MTGPASQTSTRDIYSVSRLNREARRLLEDGFPRIWLEGELSNLARPASGHLYFSIKDAGAQIRAAMFRNRNRALRFGPEDGLQVLVRGKLSLYEPRGDYQLIVEHMEEAGDGILQRAFEALKQKLAAEGLFDNEHKQPLPSLPGRIGVITSPSGAAIRDVLTVLGRRFPAIPVRIYPVPVQGREAAAAIAAAVKLASRRRDCDVLILTRGGGSLEDLWPFNEEAVARAIFECQTPLVSAVGHEVDFTIADFVADRRAATPSAAAELVTPDQQEWLQHLGHLETRLYRRLMDGLGSHRQSLTWLHRHLYRLHPGQTLRQQAQRLDDLERRLRLHMAKTINGLRSILNASNADLQRYSPASRIAELQMRRHNVAQRLGNVMQTRLTTLHQALAINSRALHSISPLATLQRGYAIVSKADGGILRSARETRTGEQVSARLAQGHILCNVAEICPDEPGTVT